MPKPLNLIVACAENRVIGRGGKLPWHIPEDLKFFHAETAGQICVLGRVCFETWPRATLDGRRPVVISSRLLAGARRHERQRVEGVRLAATVPDALAIADALPGEIYICGGQRIFEETLVLDRPMRLHLTLIHAEVPGDTFFPEWRHLPWREVSRRESADANVRYTFFTLEK
ncbi:MAG: dihydrofolate reductase [Verrucomicrobia bacterium]|nr:dihydrofolate reductase [Verrucomicrobiota bacterium]